MKKIINNTGTVFWKSPYNPYSAYTISEFILNGEISCEILQQAVNDALVAYPRLSYSCVSEEGKLYCVENDLPLEVQIAEKPLLPDGEVLNGHLFSVTLWKERLTFVFHHSLGDGTAAKTFISFMLQRYADLKSGNAPAVTGPLYDVDYMNEELNASKLDYPKDFQPDEPLARGETFALPAHETVFTTDSFRVREDGFMRYIKEKNTSPAIAVCAMMAKQVIESKPNCNGPINFYIVCNLREHVGLEKSLTNCINNVFLSMTSADLQQENYMETLRTTFKRRASTDYVRYDICKNGGNLYKDIMTYNPSFGISYTGKSAGGNLGFIKRSNIYRLMRGQVVIDMKAQDGWFNVSVPSDNQNNPVTDMLKKAFRKVGLEIFEETKTVIIPENGRITIEHF